MSVERGGPLPEPRIVDKPWGREEWLVVGERIVMKRLIVRAGHRFSLQRHRVKEEAWLFVTGAGSLRIGDDVLQIEPGMVVHLRPDTVHRIEATEDLELIEASTPELDDVVRLDDDYGRAGDDR